MPSSCTNAIINKDISGPQVKIKTQCQEFRQKKKKKLYLHRKQISNYLVLLNCGNENF